MMILSAILAVAIIVVGFIYYLTGLSHALVPTILLGCVSGLAGQALLFLSLVRLCRSIRKKRLAKLAEGSISMVKKEFLLFLPPFALLVPAVLVFLLMGALENDWELFFWGVFFLPITIAITWYLFRNIRSEKTLREEGRKVWAVVTQVRHEQVPVSPGRYPCALICEAEGGTYIAPVYSADPKSLEGQTLAVYISPKDPSEYFVDTAGIR